MKHLTLREYEDLKETEASEAFAAQFAMLEARAHRLVDTLTHGRLANEDPLRNNVRYCLVQLIDAMAADAAMDAGSAREVASMSNDGVSVKFATGASPAIGGSTSLRNARIVRDWLDGELSAKGIMLLYAGVDA